jgi:hypothetical protein
LQLNVYVANAADGFFLFKVVELPELTARAGTIDEIPEAVRVAAAALTGRAPEDFDVQVDF